MTGQATPSETAPDSDAALAGVSVIVACFNEAQTIEDCLARITATLPGAEVIVVCGGADDTQRLAEAMARKNPNIRVIRNYGDSGKGHAVKTGISVARHDLMVQIDADLQFMPEDIPAVVRPLIDGAAELAFGARFMRESKSQFEFSLFRSLGNRVVNRYVGWLIGQRIYDVTTGLKAWTRRAMFDINYRDNRFLYEMEIAVRGHNRGYAIAMVPITYMNRAAGVSGHGSGLAEQWSIARTGMAILLHATVIAVRRG